MIKIYPAESRYTADYGWLKTSHSFSFSEYYDPNNMNFGVLRVLNDDIVKPKQGFATHPHRDMEIVSVVLQGQLKHEDSTGGSGVLRFGEIQRMTAGTGVLHSEYNPSDTEEVNFLQLWFLPEKLGLTPSYEHVEFDPEELQNRLLPVVSKRPHSQRTAYIHQDVTIYLSQLEAGKSLAFQQKPDRKIFMFVIEGGVRLNGKEMLKKRDSARIQDVSRLEITTDSGAFLMLIDLI
jgi:hypothetical protein